METTLPTILQPCIRTYKNHLLCIPHSTQHWLAFLPLLLLLNQYKCLLQSRQCQQLQFMACHMEVVHQALGSPHSLLLEVCQLLCRLLLEWCMLRPLLALAMELPSQCINNSFLDSLSSNFILNLSSLSRWVNIIKILTHSKCLNSNNHPNLPLKKLKCSKEEK